MPDALKMSVSRLTRYKACPQAYKLDKIDKVWQKPAAWFVQGSAFHDAAEAYELSDRAMTLDELEEKYTEAFWTHQDDALSKTPNTKLWYWSGPYDGKADLVRRYGKGKEQLGKLVQWLEQHPEDKPQELPNGAKAVEVPFEIDLNGIPIRGYIDAINERVRDYKTGNRKGDTLQLETYKVAAKKQYDIDVNEGDFWYGVSGKASIPVDLSGVTEESLEEVYRPVYDDILAGKFDPTPDADTCNFCSVKWACPVFN